MTVNWDIQKEIAKERLRKIIKDKEDKEQEEEEKICNCNHPSCQDCTCFDGNPSAWMD